MREIASSLLYSFLILNEVSFLNGLSASRSAGCQEGMQSRHEPRPTIIKLGKWKRVDLLA